MIRTIEYTVMINGVTPTAPQFCGVQGEHGATKIQFGFDGAVTEYLTSAATAGDIKYRVDTENAFGTVTSGQVLSLTDYEKVEYTVPQALSRYGGTARITLVITVFDAGNENYETLMTVPVRVYFEEFPAMYETDVQDLNVFYTDVKALRDNTCQLAAEAEEKYDEMTASVTSALAEINALGNIASGLVSTVQSAAASAAASAETVTAVGGAVSEYAQNVEEGLNTVTAKVSSAAASAESAASSAASAEDSAEQAALSAAAANTCKTAAQSAKTSVENTVNGFVSEIGESIASLVDGKIPMSQIPAVSLTGTVFTGVLADMEDVSASDGDIYVCTDERETYIYSDGWTRLLTPSDVTLYAGYADTCGTAENSEKLAGCGVEVMTPAQYAAITPLENTFYLVG